jgi:hypothetical protein
MTNALLSSREERGERRRAQGDEGKKIGLLSFLK